MEGDPKALVYLEKEDLMDAFKFHDKALSEAVKKGASDIQSFQKTLDEATADIKQLEHWLQSTGFCIEVLIEVEATSIHRIGWCQVGGVWRLGFTTNEVISKRSLSDASARVRLEARPYLADLIAEITDLVT